MSHYGIQPLQHVLEADFWSAMTSGLPAIPQESPDHDPILWSQLSEGRRCAGLSIGCFARVWVRHSLLFEQCWEV